MRKFLLAATAVAALALVGTQTADAATTAGPNPSPDGGVITVCPGTSLSLDDTMGIPLPVADQQALIDATTFMCDHPVLPQSSQVGANSSSLAGVAPNAVVIDGVGYLAAQLSISPGAFSANAAASSMPYGPQKTLSCEYRIGGGAWQECGGPITTVDTYASTSTVGFCPVPGLLAEVYAFLTYGGADYYDYASGVTE